MTPHDTSSLPASGGSQVKSEGDQDIADAHKRRPRRDHVRRYNCEFPVELFERVKDDANASRVSIKAVVVNAVDHSLRKARRRPRPPVYDDMAAVMARTLQLVAHVELMYKQMPTIGPSTNSDASRHLIPGEVELGFVYLAEELQATRRQLSRHLSVLPPPCLDRTCKSDRSGIFPGQGGER
jgi:hypothetical protein